MLDVCQSGRIALDKQINAQVVDMSDGSLTCFDILIHVILQLRCRKSGQKLIEFVAVVESDLVHPHHLKVYRQILKGILSSKSSIPCQ